MKRFTLALLFLLIAASVADAGPFRRRSSGGGGGVSAAPAGADTSTAQGVAEAQARMGRMAHLGGNSSFEGVGMGPTAESALRNCCNNGRPVIDEGVARGANGMFFACRRYAR